MKKILHVLHNNHMGKLTKIEKERGKTRKISFSSYNL